MEPFHADWFGQCKYDSFKYLLLVIFETDDNYSIRFEMKKNTIRTALVAACQTDGRYCKTSRPVLYVSESYSAECRKYAKNLRRIAFTTAHYCTQPDFWLLQLGTHH